MSFVPRFLEFLNKKTGNVTLKGTFTKTSGFSIIVYKCNDASNVILLKLYEKPTRPKVFKFLSNEISVYILEYLKWYSSLCLLCWNPFALGFLKSSPTHSCYFLRMSRSMQHQQHDKNKFLTNSFYFLTVNLELWIVFSRTNHFKDT